MAKAKKAEGKKEFILQDEQPKEVAQEAAAETTKAKKAKAGKKKGLTRAEHRRVHKHGKRYEKARVGLDLTKKYPVEEAIELAKKASTVKFDAALDVHVHLQIDKTKPETLIRGTALLPHGTGKKLRVAAFVPADKEAEAKEAGAVLVGSTTLIDEIAKTGKCDFDVAVATPDMMKLMGKIARTLGQKGLMPSPKTETITTNPAKTIKELAGGKISFKTDETGNIHQNIGKVSFDSTKLADNYKALIDTIEKGKPESVKGAFIQDITIASSMGPGVRVVVSVAPKTSNKN